MESPIKRYIYFIPLALLSLALIFYLVLFFSFSVESILGEVNSQLSGSGFRVNAGDARKSLPLNITFHDVVVSKITSNESVIFNTATLELKIFEYFGGTPLELTLTDPNGNSLSIDASRDFRKLAISATNFDFSPANRVSLPSFFINSLNLKLGDISISGEGIQSARGKGIFSFDHITFSGRMGFDINLTDITGEAIIRNDSLYIKDGTCTLFSSNFNFEGSLFNIQSPGGPQVDIEATSENPSPMLSNFLKSSDEHGKNLTIGLKGNLASPTIEILSN